MTKEYTITKEEGIKRICEAVRETYAISDAIDDEHLATNSTFSSVKINSLLSDIDTRVDNLENGSGSGGSGGGITIDNALSDTSENAVQNKVIKASLDEKASKALYGDTAINVGRKTGTTVGAYSTAEGRNTTASGDYSHAEGSYTTASGNHSHAEGSEATASGNYGSHAEGFQTTASGQSSHAEGSNASSSGTPYANRTIAVGEESINIKGSTALGINSHAEGTQTLAYKYSSHAEGFQTTASGDSSHAEGSKATASGNYSHAGGYYSTSKGLTSFAHGDHVNTNNNYEVAFGKYNTSNSDTLFSVGDGASSSNTHNAFEVTTNGGKLRDKNIATEDDIPVVMTGATSSSAGTSGLVPAPASGEQGAYLRGDGTWAVPTNTDTKVTNTLNTTAKAYVTGTISSSTNTGTQVFDTGVYLDTTAGMLTATTFKGELSGNASSSSKLVSSSYTTITINTSDWTTNSDGGYIYEYTLPLAIFYTNFVFDVVLSTDQSAAKLQIEAWNNIIADGEITQTTSNGGTTAFTFYAFTTQPSVALTVGIQGVS